MNVLPLPSTYNKGPHAPLRLGALLGVLGVVYGDIGTSPLYALQASLGYFAKTGLQYADIFGVLSLIFWALIITVTLKYVTFVMRADNHGEGGILALMALAQRVARSTSARSILGIVGIIGAAVLIYTGVRRWSRSRAGAMETEPFALFIGKNAIFALLILFFSYQLASYKGLPEVLIIMGVLILIYAFVTTRMTIGRRIYALGGNRLASGSPGAI